MPLPAPVMIAMRPVLGALLIALEGSIRPNHEIVTPDLIRGPALFAHIVKEAGSRVKPGMTG